MENFLRSPLGLSLADRFRKTVSPKQTVTQALSDIQANLPTKQIIDDQNQTETRSEPQPNSNIQKKKIISEPSPQTTPNAQQIEDAVSKAFEAGVNKGVKSRQGSLIGSYISTRTNPSKKPSVAESTIMNDPRNYEAESQQILADQSMFDPTIITTNQSKRNKTFDLSFPQANKVPSRTRNSTRNDSAATEGLAKKLGRRSLSD